ncbi:MAG: restriction endonuclease [Leptospirales bacterium]|nr:restriction endonuclease [Leptospirales bacterium]
MTHDQEFEQIVEQIYRSLHQDAVITRNEKLPGRRSGELRQIDITIRANVAGHKILVIVECKNYSRKVDVKKVDESFGMLDDVGAQKAVLVARKGFSKTAIQRARRSAIDLCQIHDAATRDWKLDLRIPIHREELQASIGINFKVHLEAGDTITEKSFHEQFQQPIGTEFNRLWTGGEIPLTGENLAFTPPNPPTHLTTDAGVNRKIENLAISYSVSSSHYFGYASDLPSSKAILSHTDNMTHLTFRVGDIADFKDSLFSKFDSPDDFPITPLQAIRILQFPQIDTGPFIPNKIGRSFDIRRISE